MKLFRDTNNSETPFSVKSRHVMEGSYQDKKTDKTEIGRASCRERV